MIGESEEMTLANKVTLLSEQFQEFELGMFSADVGPHTEYHFLPEAAPKNGWLN